jgi:GrpB-like predicted nucleotidyltransferase (UPF0157 family)
MSFSHWKEQYETEKTRLLGALGNVVDGGIVESIQHIGATSVPGMRGSACIDIGLAIWPFPLEAGPKSRLEALGYQIKDGFPESLRQQRFWHESGSSQLFIFEPGMGDWYDFLLVGDYLRHNDKVRDEFSAQKSNAAQDKSALFAELLPEAHQWWIGHYGFAPLEMIMNDLKEAAFPWFVAGGWALELFTGRVQRVHHDVDIIIPRSSQFELQEYLLERHWKLITPFEKRLERWPPHMRLELPRHQVHAHRDDTFIDILLTDVDEVWRYRREPLILRSKEKMSLRSENDIPYLAPEIVLLFKSRNTSNHGRTKDQSDFENALPNLEPERRAWLHWALVATAPDHPWIAPLR